jgi:hypothetical protein
MKISVRSFMLRYDAWHFVMYASPCIPTRENGKKRERKDFDMSVYLE